MATAPSGTVTFLFTDIEGSTKRWEAFPAAMREAVHRHDRLMRGAIEAADGHVFKTVGDAFCAVFATPIGAVSAAIAAQRALLEQDWSAVDGLFVRMSLHSGVADERDNDYFGPAVNRVARLLSAAHGRQILLSGVTQALVSDHLSSEVHLIDLGSHRLKDLGRSEQVFQLAHPDLPTDFPAVVGLASFPNNLPLQLTSFVGREVELTRVKALLTSVRMLTLTGFGGSGKTRLALQAALEQIEHYPDGVWWVGLAPIRDDGQVAGSIASSLGLREERGRTVEDTVVDHLRPRQMLLLLDNCEHLLDACRNLVTRLLLAAPGCHFLATSREGLGVSGETVWSVPPLRLPQAIGRQRAAAADLAALAASESVQLFLDRASSVKPDFALTADNAPAVVEICRRLDANPLAIELAATRVRAMTPQQIAERLEQRFRLLTGGSRSALPQQQTLRAALDWSHDLLDDRERRLFRRLSVFAGGWLLEAAEAVCADRDGETVAGEPIADWDVLDLASQLIAKSLVNVDDEAGMRHWMQQTVREYAAEQLAAAGEQEALARRHALQCLSLAEAAEAELAGPGMGEALLRLDRERANLLSALAWSASGGDVELALRLGGALWRYWYLRGRQAEGRESLERVLEAAQARGIPDSPVLAKAFHGAGTLATFQGDYPAARAWLEKALALWRALGDEAAAFRSLNNLAIVTHEHGDYVAARCMVQECMEAMLRTGDQAALAQTYVNAGTVALEMGDLDDAEAGFRKGLAIHEGLSDPPRVAQALRQLGATALERGNLEEARRRVDEAMPISRELGDSPGIAECLSLLSEIAHREGDPERALARAGEWLDLEREAGDPWGIAMALGTRGTIATDAGDDSAALADLTESLRLLDAIGYRRGQASALNGLGRLALRRGDLGEARQLMGRALGLRRSMGSPLHLLDSLETILELGARTSEALDVARLAGASAALRQGLGVQPTNTRRAALDRLVEAVLQADAGSAAAMEAGRDLDLDQALLLAQTVVDGS
jgi:predicted ATPase/class 3 adenylate cyclase